MAHSSKSAQLNMTAQGYSFIAPSLYLGFLDTCLHQPLTVAGIFKVDWAKWARHNGKDKFLTRKIIYFLCA